MEGIVSDYVKEEHQKTTYFLDLLLQERLPCAVDSASNQTQRAKVH